MTRTLVNALRRLERNATLAHANAEAAADESEAHNWLRWAWRNEEFAARVADHIVERLQRKERV